MKRGTIIFMGLPGSGKGTQAFRLVERFPNFVHFDTSVEIYRRLYDPALADDPKVGKLREIYEAGILLSGYDPRWVADLVVEQIHFHAKQGKGTIFSGSPRTLPEAEGIIPLLLKMYGKDRILTLILSISEGTARKRSRNRLVCRNPQCRYTTTKEHAEERCPKCGKKLPTPEEQKNENWKVSKLETRLKEYREHTLPAIEHLRSLGLSVEEIDAERSPDKIFADVTEVVKNRLG